MGTTAWTAEWPRCLLLLELAARYAKSGRSEGCAKLKDRLEEWRRRMEDAPPPIHSLISELCYVCWLLGRGELATARHHVAEAQRKAEEIGWLIQGWQCEEARRGASNLRRRSWQLQRRARDLRERSELLLAQSAALRQRRPASPGAVSAQEALDSERVPA
jgi:hypothetical protein